MSAQSMAAPYTKAVVAAMRKLYPEALADKSFDNTGLLLEAPFNPARRQKNSVLLTIDLTKAVADEAIRRRDSCIVTYHPIIFRALKSLTLEDSQQQSLLRLAAEGISVYSPHTAVDAASGGLGDWLADIVSAEPTNVSDPQTTQTSLPQAAHSLQHHPSPTDGAAELGKHEHERDFIRKVNVANVHGAGMGRIVRFGTAVPLTHIIDRITASLGDPRAVQLAIPQGKSVDEIKIKSVAVCAGSGGSLFSELGEKVDLLFTGELVHHEALAAIEKGQSVVCVFHSNSERGFLRQVLKKQLEDAIPEKLETVRSELAEQGYAADALKDSSSEVHVSEVDRDPFGMMFKH